MLRGRLPAETFDRILARAPELRWVHSATAGVERVLTPASRARGLTITNARGVFSRPIAEYVMLMMLAAARRLPQLLELQAERTWQPLEARELRDVTVGIVGLGSIGRAVGALATAFGCRVIATRRRAEEGAAAADGAGDEPFLGSVMLDRVLPPDRLPELLAESDFVVLAAPLTADTRRAHRRGRDRGDEARRLGDQRRARRAGRRAGARAGAAVGPDRRRGPGHVPRGAAPRRLAAVRPAERDPDAAHVVVVDPRAGPVGGPVLRQPAALRGRASRWSTSSTRPPGTEPAARRPESGATGSIVRCRSPSSGWPGPARQPCSTRSPAAMPRPAATAASSSTSGVVKVPDERLDKLAEVFKPKKIVHADVTYVDLPAPPASTEGRVGAEELPAEHLARLRDSDALIHVAAGVGLRGAARTRRARWTPARDLENLDLEFMLADLAMVDRRLERLRGAGRHGTPAEREANEREEAILARLKPALEAGRPIRDEPLDADEEKALRGYRFLTQKPVLVLLNVGEGDIAQAPALADAIRAGYDHQHALVDALSARIEMELGRAGAGRGGGVHGGARADRVVASTA